MRNFRKVVGARHMNPVSIQFLAIKAPVHDELPFVAIAKQCRTDVMTVAKVAGEVATTEYRRLLNARF